MLTRRSVLLGSTLSVAAMPALAQPHRVAAHHPAAGKDTPKDALPPSTDGPAQTPIGPVDTSAHWAFIEDFNTGATLLDKRASEQMPPSSMTKLMTLYIVLDRLRQGRMKLDDQLPVSEDAWRMGGSKMFVKVGDTVSVQDLLRGVIVDSGNDACIVLAEAISGSQAQFANLMNDYGKKLGLINSHFLNPTGWPDDGHYMCCRDIATLAADIIREFPQYYHFFDEKTFTYDNITQQNRNPLVMRGMADGLKTGHTDAGGYGVVASTDRNGRRVILVLNGMPSWNQRVEQSERLMDWAFANFDDVTLFAAAQPVDEAPVWLGESPTVPLVAGHDLVVTMPRNWRNHAKMQISYDAPVRAPVAKGAPLGKLTLSGDGVPAMEVPLVAGVDVPKMSLPGRAFAVVTHFVTGS
ncbi:MAG TPA: D-alanyl-D-alanine carboxypeptidase family protein [Acetobacteraceae bacterium]|nr:D-alanyl-D-alanine carboxypeptidase family protein [Acetobacteraceae bacterium]